QLAAAAADRTDKADRCARFDAGNFQRDSALSVTPATGLMQVLLPKDRWDHAVGRAVAYAGGDKQDQEHRQEAGKILDPDKIENADRSGAHSDEIPERHDCAPDLVGQ